MTKNERIRRAALLCCHLTRNLAYFQAGLRELSLRKEGDFWVTVVGNFIDVSVLEWSKLFGDHDGKHHWKKIFQDKELFKERLQKSVGISQTDWNKCWHEIKNYRDKFIAHLDSDHIMHVPHMDIPHRMVTYYYEELFACCAGSEVMAGLPADISVYYNECFSEAVVVLNKININKLTSVSEPL